MHIFPLLLTWAFSDHFCVFFTIAGFIQQKIPERTVRKRYLTTEVAANLIDLLHSAQAEILPSSCDFIVDSFDSKLSAALEKVAPHKLKTIKQKITQPWKRN